MNELDELKITLKELFEQRDDLIPEIEKLSPEHQDLMSKFKSISDRIVHKQLRFQEVVSNILQEKE
nr:hypothetical protein [uncultured Desulfobacter sp.]